jgi:hypothetical protein
VLVLNKSSNKIELHQVEKGFIYEKGGAYVPLVATRSNDRVELFSENMSEFTPWLASLGRIHLYEAVSSAEAFLNKKKINMQVDGMKDVPVTQVISKEMIMALIYTERDPNNLEGVKSREEFLNYASNVDIIIALKGDRAYVDDISDVSATGIAQLMRGTYDDIRKYFPERRFPGLTRPTYEETVESMEDSLVAMYLLLERKVEIIAEQNKEIWGPDEVREHFLKSPKKPLALAIAYNQGTSIPAEYLSSGKTSLITGYAKAVGNVLKYLAPVT